MANWSQSIQRLTKSKIYLTVYINKFLSTCIYLLRVLVQAGVDVNTQDFDGWTPLHAAAHWGQREACEILVENFCDMDMKNYVVS